MKTIIHVNQHVIKSNLKHNKKDPPLTCKTYKDNRCASTAIIMKDGEEVGRFVYKPNKPLSCGAKIWFETNNKVITVDSENI